MKTQPHRPFFWIVCSYGVGIFAHLFFDISFGLICATAFGIALLAMALMRQNILSTLCLLLLFLCLGIINAQNYQFLHGEDVAHVSRYYYGKNIKIKGMVASDVDQKAFFNGKRAKFVFKITEVRSPWGWKRKKGKILVQIFNNASLQYGNVLLLEGKLHRPYNFSDDTNFSYRKYLYNHGIRFILSVKKNVPIKILAKDQGSKFKAKFFKLRNHFKDVLNTHLTRNEAGIMKAILLGDRSLVPSQIRELFVRTGTIHILAISGLHVGIVTGLFFVFLRIFPIHRNVQLAITILLVIGYMCITGGRPSVVRATVMSVIFLGSLIFERESDMLNTLACAAFVLLLFNPLNLFDIGFQLSFICVLSIILFNDHIRNGLKKLNLAFQGKFERFFLDSLVISISVWIGIVGIIAYYFQIITPITILANLVVVPFISIVVTLGLGLLVIGSIFPLFAYFFALCTKIALNMMVGCVFIFDQVPFSHIYVRNITLNMTISYYIFITLSIFFLSLGKSNFTALSTKIDKFKRV